MKYELTGDITLNISFHFESNEPLTLDEIHEQINEVLEIRNLDNYEWRDDHTLEVSWKDENGNLKSQLF
ncbi:MAG: hypothetical protein AAFO04_19290 [Cyanobacteria bacterium J06592_8]